MSKFGEMMGNGNVVVADDYDVAEPEHYTLIVLEDGVVHERSKNMPLLAILQGALGAGVGKNTLTAFVEGVIEDVYNDTSNA